MEKIRIKLPPAISFSIIFIAVVLTFVVLYILSAIFIPFVVAYFLYFVFSPIHKYFEKKRFPIYLILIIDALIISVLFFLVSLIMIESFTEFAARFPEYETKINNIVNSVVAQLSFARTYIRHFELSDVFRDMDYSNFAGIFFTSTFSLLGTAIFILFFFIFIVLGHENIYNSVRRRFISTHIKSDILPVEIQKSFPVADENAPQEEAVKFNLAKEEEMQLQNTFKEITDQIQKYITAKFLISLISAVIEGLIIWAFGIDFALMFAVLIFLLNFIPNIGSLVGLGFPIIMSLIEYDSFWMVLLFSIVLIATDMIMGNFVEPKVFGETLNLNPIVVLLALLLWGYIWGAVGAILSVPLTAVIKIIISRSDSPNLVFLNDLMSNKSG